jgi:FOG: HEAT repeat
MSREAKLSRRESLFQSRSLLAITNYQI